MRFGFATRTWSGIDQNLGTGAGLAKVKTMVMQFMLEVYWRCTILQGCARRKIEGLSQGSVPVKSRVPRKLFLWKKLRFSGCPGAKVRRQRPLGAVGVWKSRKPESGIGMGIGTETGTETGNGNGNGTGTVMWAGTDKKTGTSFTLIYFNSYSSYMKHKKTSMVSCSPWISIYYGNEKVKKAASLTSKATALQVHHAFCVYVHRLCTTTTWSDQILLSSLGKVNGKAINFIVSVWTRTRSPALFPNL